jgi:hypothetical protein
MARTAVLSADVVLAVSRPSAKGVHALVRIVSDLADTGVAANRIVPVFNVAPRHPRARAELAAAFTDLAETAVSAGSPAAPLFLPARKVDDAMRDAVPLPAPLPTLLTNAFDAVMRRVGGRVVAEAREPELVAPGSLGAWFEEETS